MLLERAFVLKIVREFYFNVCQAVNLSRRFNFEREVQSFRAFANQKGFKY